MHASPAHRSLVLAACAMMAATASAMTVNYVPNPGFETCTGAPMSWLPVSSAPAACEGANPHSGSFSLSLTNPPDAGYAAAQSDCVAVPPGTVIQTFGFSYRTGSAGVLQVAVTAYAYSGADCTGGTGITSSGAGFSFGTMLATDGNWHTVPGSALIDSATHSVRFVASFQHDPPSSTATVFFDDLMFATNAPNTTTTSTIITSTTTTTVPSLVYPGTGNVASECYVTLQGVAATSPGRIACTDGDPACDADAAADGTCTFVFRVCVAQLLSGCQATSIASVTAAPPSLGIPVPPVPAGAATCGDAAQVTVPLRKGGAKAGRRKVTFAARNSAKPKVDRDRVRLECLPSA